MQYLGGKSSIAKEIAAVVAPRGEWWEPFCGGLSVSVQLAKYGPGVVSDACLPLISLYQAVRDGWEPPKTLTRDEWEAAKRLPDTNPLKAFAGFGCSFSGLWFQSYAGGVRERIMNTASGPQPIRNDPPMAAGRGLKRDAKALASCLLKHVSFFSVDPSTCLAQPECIYADPPYAGTTRYSAVAAFDHARFWSYCQIWASRGVRVFVSEYVCPVGADLVWEKQHLSNIRQARSKADPYTTERLFRILPSQEPKVACL